MDWNKVHALCLERGVYAFGGPGSGPQGGGGGKKSSYNDTDYQPTGEKAISPQERTEEQSQGAGRQATGVLSHAGIYNQARSEGASHSQALNEARRNTLPALPKKS